MGDPKTWTPQQFQKALEIFDAGQGSTPPENWNKLLGGIRASAAQNGYDIGGLKGVEAPVAASPKTTPPPAANLGVTSGPLPKVDDALRLGPPAPVPMATPATAPPGPGGDPLLKALQTSLAPPQVAPVAPQKPEMGLGEALATHGAAGGLFGLAPAAAGTMGAINALARGWGSPGMYYDQAKDAWIRQEEAATRREPWAALAQIPGGIVTGSGLAKLPGIARMAGLQKGMSLAALQAAASSTARSAADTPVMQKLADAANSGYQGSLLGLGGHAILSGAARGLQGLGTKAERILRRGPGGNVRVDAQELGGATPSMRSLTGLKPGSAYEEVVAQARANPARPTIPEQAALNVSGPAVRQIEAARAALVKQIASEHDAVLAGPEGFKRVSLEPVHSALRAKYSKYVAPGDTSANALAVNRTFKTILKQLEGEPQNAFQLDSLINQFRSEASRATGGQTGSLPKAYQDATTLLMEMKKQRFPNLTKIDKQAATALGKLHDAGDTLGIKTNNSVKGGGALTPEEQFSETLEASYYRQQEQVSEILEAAYYRQQEQAAAAGAQQEQAAAAAAQQARQAPMPPQQAPTDVPSPREVLMPAAAAGEPPWLAARQPPLPPWLAARQQVPGPGQSTGLTPWQAPTDVPIPREALIPARTSLAIRQATDLKTIPTGLTPWQAPTGVPIPREALIPARTSLAIKEATDLGTIPTGLARGPAPLAPRQSTALSEKLPPPQGVRGGPPGPPGPPGRPTGSVIDDPKPDATRLASANLSQADKAVREALLNPSMNKTLALQQFIPPGQLWDDMLRAQGIGAIERLHPPTMFTPGVESSMKRAVFQSALGVTSGLRGIPGQPNAAAVTALAAPATERKRQRLLKQADNGAR